MKYEVKVFDNIEFGKFRTIEDNGTIWFCGVDIAKTLGYQNPQKAISDHCNNRWVTKYYIPHPQSENKQLAVTFITEGNVYRLITHSKLPSAERFETWLFDELLPQIHRTGSYSAKSENSNATLVTITPDMAKEMLKGNLGNRKLNMGSVNRIATDMLMGKYAVNGTSIKIYKDGTLADGQTRLTACIKANVPFTTYVIRGLDKNVLPTIDCGRPRSLVDTLNMTGCTIQKKLVPAMNAYFTRGLKLTASQAQVLWNEYEDKFTMLCDALAGGHHDHILSQASVRCYLIHLAISENWGEDDIRTFITGIKDKPTRTTAYEMSCYNFRNFYNRKIHNKLRDTKSLGDKSKSKVVIDALCTLADSYKSDKIVKSFTWRNRARSVLDTGYNLAQQRFALLETEIQNRIAMVG